MATFNDVAEGMLALKMFSDECQRVEGTQTVETSMMQEVIGNAKALHDPNQSYVRMGYFKKYTKEADPKTFV